MAATIAIKFTHDKNGKKIAHRHSLRQFRWFRMPLADAELMIATGTAQDVTHEQWTVSPGLTGKIHQPGLSVIG